MWTIPTTLDELVGYLAEFVAAFNDIRASKNRSPGTVILFTFEDGGYAEFLLVEEASTSGFIKSRPVDAHTFKSNDELFMNRNSRQKEFDNRGELLYAGKLNKGIIAELGGPKVFARKIADELEKPHPANVPEERTPMSREGVVLIVHGRDHATRDAIELYIRDLGLATRRMDAEAHGGRSLPEKWEDVARDVSFAVFVITADDDLKLAGRDEKTDEVKWEAIRRPRQNVILEIGYVWGAVGRKGKTAFLLDRRFSDVDLPTDILGLGWIPITQDLAETKLGVQRELKKAGLIE